MGLVVVGVAAVVGVSAWVQTLRTRLNWSQQRVDRLEKDVTLTVAGQKLAQLQLAGSAGDGVELRGLRAALASPGLVTVELHRVDAGPERPALVGRVPASGRPPASTAPAGVPLGRAFLSAGGQGIYVVAAGLGQLARGESFAVWLAPPDPPDAPGTPDAPETPDTPDASPGDATPAWATLLATGRGDGSVVAGIAGPLPPGPVRAGSRIIITRETLPRPITPSPNVVLKGQVE